MMKNIKEDCWDGGDGSGDARDIKPLPYQQETHTLGGKRAEREIILDHTLKATGAGASVNTCGFRDDRRDVTGFW
ncbi:hypothetical protein GN958_ATG16138 [Phytophthora infestans]|uniref:Uncharacterized protein n=1 Tax=Phytophthora infestans TaxID=4787 RepID=A0A8S9U164_PHYIN|nr:hypothetical protein GN958_ATG16138 [Phytophthora infestans]